MKIACKFILHVCFHSIGNYGHLLIIVHALTPAVAHDVLEKTPSAKVKPLIPHKEAYISSSEVCLDTNSAIYLGGNNH